MDCEKFDLCVIDALYDELDELTSAALKRHVEGCSRCAGILTGLRATREVGLLPIAEPSDDFEARILERVATAQRTVPWPRKVMRSLAWAGSHAMRPQLAMAAIFFLVAGSSLLLLRARPGTVGGPVFVTERGAPGPDVADPQATARSQPLPVAQPARPAEDTAEPRGEPKLPKDGDKEPEKAERATEAKVALEDARKLRQKSGCDAALGKFDDVGARFPGTAAAADAMWESANCYRGTGDQTKARELYQALRSNPTYKDRAQQELDKAEPMAQNALPATRAAAPTPAAVAVAPAQTVAAASPPAAKPVAAADARAEAPANTSLGSSSKAVAAPKKAAPTSAGF